MASVLDLHAVANYSAPKVDLPKEFDVIQEIGEGWFAKVFHCEHKSTRTELVLKAVHQDSGDKNEFFQEFHYSQVLGVLNNAKEYAPFGDLASNVSDIGIGEIYCKRVAKQIGAALDFLHERRLVHRDVKIDNVLVFRSDFSKVKLADFGECCKIGSMVIRFNEWVPYCPPEILQTQQDTPYPVQISQDSWQFGILMFLCLTGNIPWLKADKRSDPKFQAFDTWMRSRVSRTPKTWKVLTSKARRLLRRFFDLDPNKRTSNFVDDIQKYAEDRWLTKVPDKPTDEDDLSTNMSMLSFHSSLTEKNRLLSTLTRFGVETTVDRDMKKNRIKEWVATTTVEEENEEENEEDGETSSNVTPNSSTRNSISK